ncbi:hypothetical protein GUITHDRAFT_41663, partial [Guillardia theta CCMP2712]
FVCRNCEAPLACVSDVVSRAFQGKLGRVYLLQRMVNVQLGPREDRAMITGLHVVADLHCRSCETLLGWKYLEAFDVLEQRYKEGRFAIEK